MLRSLTTALALALLLASTTAAAETMKNADVVKLVTAGFEPATIERKIESSPTEFDLGTDALVALKQAGVPDSVVRAMLAKGERKSAPMIAPKPMAAPTAVRPAVPTASAKKVASERYDVTLKKSKFGGCDGELRLDPAGVKMSNCYERDFKLSWNDVQSLCYRTGAEGYVRLVTAKQTFEFDTKTAIVASDIAAKAGEFTERLRSTKCE